MRVSKIGFAIVSLLILPFLFPVALLAGERGSPGLISGNLVNGTTGEPVPGLEVILKRHEGDQEKEEQKTLSDAEGKFYFSKLDRSGGPAYFLYTKYKDVEYSSTTIEFKDQKQEIPRDMTVYDTTDSDQKVSVVMHHVVLEPKGGDLWVRELMIVDNKDNKVYVGDQEIAPDKKETLRISLPSNAQEIQLLRGLMSCCIVQLQDGFADTMDIKPGRKEIQFRYKVDYSASKLSLLKRINLITDSLNFFMPDQGIRAEGENIQYAGLIGEAGKQFLHFTGKNLARGSQVALHIAGLPWVTGFFKEAVPILAVALLVLGFLYPLIRRRLKSSEAKMEPAPESRETSMLQEPRKSLLWGIAELDNQLDSGQISPEEHEKKRRILKEQVVELTQIMQNKEE